MKFAIFLLLFAGGFTSLFAGNLAHAEEPNPTHDADDGIALRNSDDSVRIGEKVINAESPIYPGGNARYLEFGERLKRRTGAELIELKFMSKSHENKNEVDTKDANFGTAFDFLMGVGNRMTTGSCEVPPKTEVADEHCQFWDAQGHRISSDLVHFFQFD